MDSLLISLSRLNKPSPYNPALGYKPHPVKGKAGAVSTCENTVRKAAWGLRAQPLGRQDPGVNKQA